MNSPERYNSPRAFRTALNRRVRNRATEEGRPQPRLLQMLLFERFLSRLNTIFGERVLLKGGMALELRLTQARTTKDIDLRLVGRDDDLLEALRQAGRVDLDDYLNFEIRADPRSPRLEAEGMKYQGFRFRAVAMLGGKRLGDPFGLDIAYGEPIGDQYETVSGSDLLEFIGIGPLRHRVYPLETHIAEKVHAYTLPRSHMNSRTKDLPDLALLAMVRDVTSGELRATLKRTFSHRGTHQVPKSLPKPPEAWSSIYQELAVRDRLPWKSLHDVWQASSKFLDPVLEGKDGTWNVKNSVWLLEPEKR